MTPTIMAHAALSNCDILFLIFEFLADRTNEDTKGDAPSEAGATALARCARVSSTFSPSALDALWRVLPELNPLFQLVDGFQMIRHELTYVRIEIVLRPVRG